MTGPIRSHDILAKLLVGSVTQTPAVSLPAALCVSCATDLPMTGVAMVLQSSAGLDRVVAATPGLAEKAEELQFEFGEGPGVDAMRLEGPVLRSDLVTSARQWPMFGPAAEQVGVRAAFAFPLQVGGIRLGVLDLYRDAPGRLLDGVLSEALSYAEAATAVLLHLQALAHPSVLHPQLTGFTADRAEIHQATGMIAAQARVTLVEALLLLRARAYSSDLTMLEVSREVLARRLRFDPDNEMGTA
jgi:hypothetical protein